MDYTNEQYELYTYRNGAKHIATETTGRITVKQLRDILTHANDDDEIVIVHNPPNDSLRGTGHYGTSNAYIPHNGPVNVVFLHTGYMQNDC